MAAYYNEIDPFAAAWLRELIKAGQIADGEVDERSIADVRPDDLRGFVQCHWFAGVGGWSYALRLAGWPDARPVWTGSCPCQPFSSAGAQAGGHDPRDLWPVWVQLVRECRPDVVFGEQVEAAIGHGWLDRVCDDLESEGYAVGACSLPAASVGAFHIRQRLWFVADTEHAERWPIRRSFADERDGCDAGRTETYGELGARRALCELADPETVRLRQRRADDARRAEGAGAEGIRGGSADVSGGGGLGDARCQGSSQFGRRWDEPMRSAAASLHAASRLADTDSTKCAPRFHESIGAEAARSERASSSGLSNVWSDCDWLPCADGKARPVPSIKSYVLPLADGFWYRMADVRAAFVAEGAEAVSSYATQAGCRPEEVMSMVRNCYGAQAIQWALTGPRGVSAPKVLFDFMRDIASALNRGSDGCGGTETRSEADRWMLRDLRCIVQAECASLRREPQEQSGRQPPDPLFDLSWFLARCSEACGDLASGADAAHFPLAGKIAGRTGILRGAGNAIVPQVAAVFIQAYCDAVSER